MWQDGHHFRAKYLGINETQHPDWPLQIASEFHNLFTNWHPGILGHEVMGNQLAYHYGQVLLRALGLILTEAEKGHGTLSRTFFNELKATATPNPLPPNAACADTWCNFEYTCAYQHLPHYPPGVEHWQLKAESSGWKVTKSEGLPNIVPLEQACGGAQLQSEGCRKSMQLNGYYDMKMGMRGGAGDGPLKLRIQKSFMNQCFVFLEDIKPAWEKLADFANWAVDMLIKINGKECGDACTVWGPPNAQTVKIDVRKMFGSACRHKDTDIEISVVPETPLKIAPCMKQSAINPGVGQSSKKCVPVGTWLGYQPQICERQTHDDHSDCNSLKIMRDPKNVHTFIAQIWVS